MSKADIERDFVDYIIATLASYEEQLGVEASRELRAAYGSVLANAAIDCFEKLIEECAEENEWVAT